LLEVIDLVAGYGRLTILNSLSLTIRPTQLVALFGRNGSGKSTLVKSVIGQVRATAGQIRWQGESIERFSTEQVIGRGIGIVPQNRGLFPGMTVLENLSLACFSLRLRKKAFNDSVDEIFSQFPVLATKRNVSAASLSGGEQQMLGIGKALIRKPRLLLLDEPSTGLAPSIQLELVDLIGALRRSGLTMIIAEQNVQWVLEIADTAHILEQGRIVESVDSTLGVSEMNAVVTNHLGKL
jgi:branched-chain amino acid transport system ATP-binding protein